MKNKALHRHLLFACLLLLIAFGLRISSFADLGTQADEGVYVTAGSRLLAGDLLYRDLYWNHTPGIALLEAASLKIAGPELLLGRLLSVAAATLTVGFLYWQVGRSAVLAAGWIQAKEFPCGPISSQGAFLPLHLLPYSGHDSA